jgi:hypothetical protein
MMKMFILNVFFTSVLDGRIFYNSSTIEKCLKLQYNKQFHETVTNQTNGQFHKIVTNQTNGELQEHQGGVDLAQNPCQKERTRQILKPPVLNGQQKNLSRPSASLVETSGALTRSPSQDLDQ